MISLLASTSSHVLLFVDTTPLHAITNVALIFLPCKFKMIDDDSLPVFMVPSHISSESYNFYRVLKARRI
jgi:hypothetical protein